MISEKDIKQYIKHKPVFVTIFYLYPQLDHTNIQVKWKVLRIHTNIDGGITNIFCLFFFQILSGEYVLFL